MCIGLCSPIRAFTLIELAIVVAILSIFLSLVFPRIPSVFEEQHKRDARKLTGFISNILDNVLREKKNLKMFILKEERKIEIHDCIPVDEADTERWKMSDEMIKELRDKLGPLASFINFAVPKVCEWKKSSELQVETDITSIFIDGEEMFGSEVEVLFQPAKIPLVEIELSKKLWVILNPYIFRVLVDTEPAHVY